MCLSSLYLVPWFRDASLSWQRVWGKWNANRATKFPAATAEQSLLRIFLRLDFSSWSSMNHESAQHTKQCAIARGLRGESGSTLTLLGVSQECEGKKKEEKTPQSHNCCSVCFFWLSVGLTLVPPAPVPPLPERLFNLRQKLYFFLSSE